VPLPPVVIELSTADAASPNATALVDACSAAVSDGECRLGQENRDARAIVIVSWNPEHRRAHIEIGIAREGKDRWSRRDLDFAESDPEPERWKAVGLIVGTLVGEAERSQPPASETPKETTPSPPGPSSPSAQLTPPPATAPPPGPSPTPARHRWIGATVLAGPAFDDRSWRFGPGLVGVVDLPLPQLFVSGSASYLMRPEDKHDVDARWFVLSLGVGLHHEAGASRRVEGSVEAVLDRMDATVTSSQFDRAGRWLPGVQLGIGGSYLVDRWGAVTAGAFATALSKGTVITVAGEKVGRAPPLTWGFSLGFRFEL
jgi:hypothetical protein